MKILVIALSGIGDALMFTPALKKLKEEFPASEIDALVMYKGVKEIYERLKEISKIHYWEFLKEGKIKSLLFVSRLRKKYDISINVYPSNRKEYNIINFLIGAKKRLAVKYLRKDFQNFGFLNNFRIQEDDNLHNVEENIKLCELISNKKFNDVSELILNFINDDLEFGENFLKEKNITENELVIGFHPGCSTLKNHDKRRWETDKFAELGKKLIEEHKAKILVFGGPEEKVLKEDVIKKINSHSAISVNTSSLIHTAAVMKRCNIFVTNDSSLMHIASALKLNVVAIIGPTNPNYIHPWKTNYRIASLNLDCSPCFYYSPKPLKCTRKDIQFKCIKELNTALVYNHVKSFL
ncbi:MAG: glycosyltransferase family 9 protein [Melioribacter sp.]|uniref:glycosyltransferase family 9 protein n=1 Tax=Rosettibacter primus TaxID=3111523 RepID=UPI00247D1CA2|nr:glycosyltransferase family 9 protein [Melioribacter sp.]